MQKLEKSSEPAYYGVAAVLCYLILNQGGYFAGGLISAGLIISIMLIWRKIRFGVLDFIFLAFSLWYLFCSIRAGFDVRYIAKGLLPISCLMFRQLMPENSQNARELCLRVIKLSFYITLFAIFTCIYLSVKAMRLKRLVFPFQYANASGIFFGVMFILARYAGFEWAKKRQYVFFAGLALTQSVGAVGLTVLCELFMSRDRRKTFALLAVIVIGAVVLRSRIYQSMGTFIERFLQIQDGLICMLKNPVFGIGAGRWELYKNLYQTGIYDAHEIHGSLGAIGAASGILGLTLFTLTVIAAFKFIRFENKAYLAAAVMLIVHSFMDFTFTFTTLGFLLMLIFACGEEDESKKIEFKNFAKPALLAVFAVGFCILSVGMYQIKRLDGMDAGKNYPKYVAYYEANPLSQKSVKTRENYAKALYATGKKQESLKVIESIDVLSSDMVVLKKGCIGDWKEVMKYIEQQPYNIVLYKTVCYNSNDEELRKQAEERLEEAIASMSFLGKILYEFIGEKVL